MSSLTMVRTQHKRADPEGDYRVILYNDPHHSMQEVIQQLMRACGYDRIRSEQIMMIAHTTGSARAFRGSFNECNKVVDILREIELIVEIEEA